MLKVIRTLNKNNSTVEIYSKKKCQNYNNYGNHNEKILPTVSLKINPVRGLQTHPFNQHF